MSALFRNLPPESVHQSSQETADAAAPPNKRAKLTPTDADHAPVTKPQLTSQDPVAAALIKITAHISSSRKFTKASELLRQLIVDNNIGEEHSKLVFEALKASVRDPKNTEDPQLRREYIKLFTLASKSEIFTQRELSQLDVYGTWAVIRNRLHTDDSFEFNKTLKGIKDSIEHLPDATQEEEEALQAVKQLMDCRHPAYSDRKANDHIAKFAESKARLPEEPQLPELDSANGEEAEATEADPFGLDALVPEEKRKIKLAKPTTWSKEEITGMKREALLDCFDTMQACYGHAWARTSVDLAVEALVQQREKFCSSQQARVDEFMQFVKQQRLKRKQGAAGAAKQSQRDTTAFENARKEWGRATISARGKVGAGGDHQSETWLG